MKIYQAFFVILGSLVVLSIGVVGVTKKSSGKCIQVFYDRKEATVPLMRALRMYSDYRLNSLRISDYQSGDFDRCQASFVVSVENEHKIPKVLLNEFSNNQKNISWLGGNIWQLGDQLEKTLGLRYIGKSSGISPWMDLYYRGKISRQKSSNDDGVHLIFLPLNIEKAEILVEARYFDNRELVPYLVHTGNVYYLANVNIGPAIEEFLPEMVGVPPTSGRQLVGGVSE
ncbi:MAG: hypothetical protein ACKOX6_17470 [Bdellovibrio sp.]